ncbi:MULTISPECIES: type II secretion system protein J [unclassified Actinotalea]|uniref:PulJ/GspJ family protein n=1 Tax=unclassified Actinotalea TaxID=2638618 RepID=UPI0015F3F8A2|nr:MULTISPECIES: prepilin-type N-terminal cleavage/methylation domain-containing protein [unclassified Actinotalea]
MNAPAVRTRDGGLTLIELLVSMGIFTVVLVVFMSGLISMTTSTVRAQDVTNAGDAVRSAFQTMDKQIRYADAVNRPGVGASGSYYLEFRTGAQPDGLAPLCTQWRLDPTARTLAYRTKRDVPSAPVSPWRTIATDVRNPLSGPDKNMPFRFEAAGGASARQSVTVSLDVGRGAAGPDAVTGADMGTVFVARNSSYASPSNPDLDSDGISDTPVCGNPLERP